MECFLRVECGRPDEHYYLPTFNAVFAVKKYSYLLTTFSSKPLKIALHQTTLQLFGLCVQFCFCGFMFANAL